MKQFKKYQVILILCGCVLAALIGREIARQMETHLNKLDSEIELTEAKLEDIDEQIAQTKAFVLKWDAIKGFQDRPVEVQQTDFTAYLQRLETERDFVFNILGSPVGRVIEEKSEVQILRYELSFFTDLRELVEFLGALDTSERLLRIERLTITRREGTRNEHLFPLRRMDSDTPIPTRREMLAVSMTVAIPATIPETTVKAGEEVLQ